MIENEKVQKILYGGDYNPEQWPEEVWAEDMRLFKKAHIDVVTLNVFSWAALQPDEDTYTFEKLDRIMDYATENKMKICLATSTGAHPAWMARKHPDILRTEFNGMKRKFGSRHNSCPNSSTYRKYSVLLAEKIAARYGKNPNLVAWHISNEYGGECYCDTCEKAFRVWLEKEYSNLEELNRCWNTSFWGHTFYDWEDIVLPNLLSEHFAENRTCAQSISLDYRRFMSESILDCYRLEYDAVKKITPDISITTNLMGFYKPLDYQKWAKYMDFISWDNYPSNEESYSSIALKHELMRGIKQGKPFALMEQTPSVTNWLPYNALKRPGVMRLWSYQAVAHGSDTVMFFQLRRSIGSCEKYHGAIIDHVGNEDTRVFREAATMGEELEIIGNLTLGARHNSKTAIYFDWENWWAIEYSAGPSINLSYVNEILNFYTALNKLNISTDIIGADDDMSQYNLVIAPVMYMVKPGQDEKIKDFVKNGGSFITTFFSGYVDDHDLVTPGGYPGKLRDLLGIWVEELDALPEGKENHFTYKNTVYPARLICDLLHCEGASSLSSYAEDFYEGMPAITKNNYGKGSAYYIACQSSEDFYENFLQNICQEQEILPVQSTPSGVEATLRSNKNGDFLFLLNHSESSQNVVLEHGGHELISGNNYIQGETLCLEPKAVMIIQKSV